MISEYRALAISLWREGNHAEARRVLESKLANRDELPEDELLATVNTLAVVERADGRFSRAIELIKGVGAELDRSKDFELKGKLSNNLAISLYEVEEFDSSIEFFEAAAFYYEQAGAVRLRADVDNNLAQLLIRVGRASEAHKYIERAMKSGADSECLAQIKDTRARAYIEEGKYNVALTEAMRSASILLEMEEAELLNRTLLTLETICKRIRNLPEENAIRTALEGAEGSITKAAHALGTTHQALDYKLKHQFPHLLKVKAPEKKPRGKYAKKLVVK